MLKLFEVSGFKNFEVPISLDFSDVREYRFNTDCINNDMLGKAIIYGKNAIGKSNFGLALCDVAMPKTRIAQDGVLEDYGDLTYLNSSNKTGYAEFRYVFQFGNDKVEYLYRKDAYRTFVYEKVTINDILLFEYDCNDESNRNIEGLRTLSPTLVLDFENIGSSILMYVRNNTALDDFHPLKRTVDFILGMRFISVAPERKLRQQRMSHFYPQRLFDDKLVLEELQNLFKDADIKIILEIRKDDDGKERLFAKTSEDSSSHLFYDVASSGTIALYQFFYLYKSIQEQPKNRISVVFLDEFDALYHVELAETIVNLVKKLENTQVIFTSHNTNLLSNRIMRPDCYFILSKNKLMSFVNATDRELREGHNLQNLYKSGEFDEEA